MRMNRDFEGALEPQGGEGDDETFQITAEGVQRLQEWMRFTVQVCELEHGDLGDCDDSSHIVAFLMVFILQPWISYFGLEAPVESED